MNFQAAEKIAQFARNRPRRAAVLVLGIVFVGIVYFWLQGFFSEKGRSAAQDVSPAASESNTGRHDEATQPSGSEVGLRATVQPKSSGDERPKHDAEVMTLETDESPSDILTAARRRARLGPFRCCCHDVSP